MLFCPHHSNYILSDGAAAGALILLTQRKK